MAKLPVTSEKKRKRNAHPIPMNNYKSTLSAPTSKVSQLLVRKNFKPSQNTVKKLYTVQVGAYKTKAYAQNLLKKLVGKGYNAFVVHNKIYKVQVDKFKNKQDAIKLAQYLQEKENLKNFITRTG